MTEIQYYGEYEEEYERFVGPFEIVNIIYETRMYSCAYLFPIVFPIEC